MMWSLILFIITIIIQRLESSITLTMHKAVFTHIHRDRERERERERERGFREIVQEDVRPLCDF